jgi:hypothetical protein
VAVEGAYANFVSDGGATLNRVAKCGGPPLVLADGGVTAVSRVAFDATHVYWATGDSRIARVPK